MGKRIDRTLLKSEICFKSNFHKKSTFCGKICLFVVFRPTREIVHSFADVTIACEGLQILIYARYSWPLSSEGSLACHTYYDTGHPFLIFISEDPWHSHLLPNVKQWACQCLHLRLRSVAAGIPTPNLPLARLTLVPTAPQPRFLRKEVAKLIKRLYVFHGGYSLPL